MAAGNITQALALIYAHEGGYADHARDPGGATNMGITRATLGAWRGRPVSKAEVRALGRAEAGDIYRALYWDKVAGDSLPGGLDVAMFDYAVNSGPARAAKALQKLAGAVADGIVGPRTLEAVARADAGDLVRRLCAERKAFLTRLRTFDVFGKGWMTRVEATERAALALAASAVPATGVADRPAPAARTPLGLLTGALVAIAAQVAAIATAGGGLEASAQAEDLVMQVAGLVGTVIALWGRFGGRRAS